MNRLFIEPPLLCEGNNEIIDGEKHYYVSGIYLKANRKNLNGRIYPESILKPDIVRYIQEKVNKNSAYGELEHPDRLKVKESEIAHRIVSLEWDGDYCYGKSIITPTPKGQIIEALLKTGGCIGMSSRGGGDLDRNGYITKYRMSTVDAVLDPSVAESAMNMLYENNNLILNAGGNIEKMETLQEDIKNNKIDKSKFNEEIINRFKDIFVKEEKKYKVSFEVGNSIIYATVNESQLQDLKQNSKKLVVY